MIHAATISVVFRGERRTKCHGMEELDHAEGGLCGGIAGDVVMRCLVRMWSAVEGSRATGVVRRASVLSGPDPDGGGSRTCHRGPAPLATGRSPNRNY